jgi:hypothetical protein
MLTLACESSLVSYSYLLIRYLYVNYLTDCSPHSLLLFPFMVSYSVFLFFIFLGGGEWKFDLKCWKYSSSIEFHTSTIFLGSVSCVCC